MASTVKARTRRPKILKMWFQKRQVKGLRVLGLQGLEFSLGIIAVVACVACLFRARASDEILKGVYEGFIRASGSSIGAVEFPGLPNSLFFCTIPK